jgi:hypothetical protein
MRNRVADAALIPCRFHGREDVVSGRLRWTDLTPAEWREQEERAVAELRSTGTFQRTPRRRISVHLAQPAKELMNSLQAAHQNGEPHEDTA